MAECHSCLEEYRPWVCAGVNSGLVGQGVYYRADKCNLQSRGGTGWPPRARLRHHPGRAVVGIFGQEGVPESAGVACSVIAVK